MANMPFKLSYSFEGNYRTRPEQNLSGDGRKETRDRLLMRAHEERQKRQEQRLKLSSTVVIQAFMRSYLVRQRVKHEERLKYDQLESNSDFKHLLGKFLFFYNPHIDGQRLVRICDKLLQKRTEILKVLDFDESLCWLVRRLLSLCLDGLKNEHLVKTSMECIRVFTADATSRAKVEVWPYLVTKGYFSRLRELLDKDYAGDIMELIERPFRSTISLSLMQVNLLLSEFCSQFLCPKVSSQVKTILIPYMQKSTVFPYNDLIKFLNTNKNYDATNSLLYCILALEPVLYGPSQDSIQVLATLTLNLNQLSVLENSEADDSDDEAMEVSTEQVHLQDYIYLFNHSERVKRLILYIDEHNDNEELLMSVIQLCQNLLLVYKDAIRKYMLLFMLALNGNFLNKIWDLITKDEVTIKQMNSTAFSVWKDIHKALLVFCDMFTFYTETLTDSESSDTSMTFKNSNLSSMADILKNIALSMIDLAFPMCRSSAVLPSRELLHFYSSCLNCVKTLFTLDLRKNFCKAGFWTRQKIHVSQDLPKKNYLSKTIRPFYGVVSEDEDEHLPPLSTIEQRSLAILQQLPFLIEFNVRILLLRELCRYSIGDNMRLHRDFLSDSVITIRRRYLYEDAFEKLSYQNEIDLRHRIRIQFINNAGLEEAGIDGGGIFKEFLSEVLKTSFDPTRGFFLLTNDNMLYPNPNVAVLVDNFTDHYYFIGRLVGKAIFENTLVDLPLAEFFLVKLLIDRASAYYLKSLDPILYRNLLYLREYSGDVQDLGLDFTTVNNDLGETKVIELKPNGTNISVTSDNRLEYIHRLANFKLNTQIKKQCNAFREGLDNVVPLLWLRLFNHLELQVIIGGDTQEMDIDDLKAHTSYGGEFTPEHSTMILFWKIVEKFTDTQKKQLLKFVTSCSRPPLLGFKELNPPFCIQSSGSENRMPTASTCLNLLKLPVIKEEQLLKTKLLAAIEQQAGFELS
ncbi:hypothetical protein PPYR_09686 [Photinus pyralis]|uniref:Ubiquitin-protein ligase E3C n=1 Tax=Photinus pyralis TaxID=7054 RepID=A0A1Y1KNA4_PHOPY|nr:ubiquitin-protein ligase E3C [Photinus pyralis]KAB0798693.1 hypothetical protein PPYR_09686 [Photinus pyralis]